MAIDFRLNGRPARVDVADGIRLPWKLHERSQVTPTPFLPGRVLATIRA